MARASKDKPKVKLTGTEWKYVLKRTLSEFSWYKGTDLAAQLTYFTVLAIAPTLLAVFSLAALVLQDFQDQIADKLKEVIQRSGVDGVDSAVDSTLDSLLGSSTGGTIALIIGVAIALWSASAYVKAFSRASNTVYNVPETRGPVSFNLSMYVTTAVLVVGIVVVLLSLLLTQTMLDAVADPIFTAAGLSGPLAFLSGTFMPIWAWVKWPVILVILFALLSLLYWATPNLKRPYRPISPGGIFAVIGIIVAAVAVAIYMSTVASYSSYGAIGGVMAVLFALWVMNIVMVMGGIFDSEYERAKELVVGRASEKEYALTLRGKDTPTKAQKKRDAVIAEGRDIRLQALHHNQDQYKGHFAGQTTGERAHAPETADRDNTSDEF